MLLDFVPHSGGDVGAGDDAKLVRRAVVRLQHLCDEGASVLFQGWENGPAGAVPMAVVRGKMVSSVGGSGGWGPNPGVGGGAEPAMLAGPEPKYPRVAD